METKLPKFYQKALKLLLNQGFEIHFTPLLKELGLKIKIETLKNTKDTGNLEETEQSHVLETLNPIKKRLKITVLQKLVKLNQSIAFTKIFKPESEKGSHFVLPIFDQTSIFVYKNGDLMIKDLVCKGNCIIDIEGRCHLEHVKSNAQIIIRKATEVIIKGEWLSNKGIICFSNILKNRGHIRSKNITLCLRSPSFKNARLDNQCGILFASHHLKVYAKNILNEKGVVQGGTLTLDAFKISNNAGILFSENQTRIKVQDCLYNESGLIGSKSNITSVKSVFGKIKTTELGQIISESGYVRINAPWIECDSTSLLRGSIGVDILGQCVALDSPIMLAS